MSYTPGTLLSWMSLARHRSGALPDEPRPIQKAEGHNKSFCS